MIIRSLKILGNHIEIIRYGRIIILAKVGRTFYSKDNTLWQVQANYSREFNGNNIDAMLLFEESTYKGDNFNGKKGTSIPYD